MRRGFLAFACVAATLVAAHSPAQFGQPSDADQIQLGQRAAAEIRKKERILPSYDNRTQLVRRVGERLLDTIADEKMPWKFTFEVADSKTMNAFALPGGPVFIYTGLLDKLETEDQLAGIMGHELTHVFREHWARQYAESQKRSLILGVILGVTKANTAWRSAAGVVNVLEKTKFSRGSETQADDIGFEMMVRAGYNPMGLADVFRLFERSRKKGANIPFLSTHPVDSERIKRIENRVVAMNRDFPDQRPLRYDQDGGLSRYRWYRSP